MRALDFDEIPCSSCCGEIEQKSHGHLFRGAFLPTEHCFMVVI
jgi:hypothetical protein